MFHLDPQHCQVGVGTDKSVSSWFSVYCLIYMEGSGFDGTKIKTYNKIVCMPSIFLDTS